MLGEFEFIIAVISSFILINIQVLKCQGETVS